MKTFLKVSDTEYEVTETKTAEVVDRVIVNLSDALKRKAELETELQSINDILDNVDKTDIENITTSAIL